MSAAQTDPVLFSVLLGRFNSIVNEMTLTLEYSAWTSILALNRDFSCAIYDAEPRQLCMYDALPSHTASLQLVLREIARTFEGNIHEGDVFACNSPYRWNSHVGDLVTVAPVFVDGEHLFWSVTKGHQMDTGATVPSSVSAVVQNVWQEGLHIPPLKLYDAGRRRDDVFDLYLSNVRYREHSEGDLLAQLGSVEKGRERLVELVREFGAETVTSYADAMLAYSDRRMSEEIAAVPDGEYLGEGWVDTDGYDAFDIPIKVKVTVEGEQVRIDLDGSGPQARGGVNGSYATTQAAAAIPFMQYIDPDIPHNDGCLRHIECYAPEGTIVNARFPAATSAATIVPSDAIQDTVNKAMAAALPSRVPAGGARCGNTPQLAGVDERTGEPWGVMLFNGTGGAGGTEGADGWPLVESIGAAGGVKAQPVEQLELLYPIRIERMEIETDSMGFGAFNGGPGVRCEVRPLAGEMECITFGDNYANPPHGVLGGTPGIGGGMYVEESADGSRSFITATAHVVVREGDLLVGVSTGGGGYGNPVERDPERVRCDVRDGLVSRTAARALFGVVLTDDADPQVDTAATTALRAELATIERPLVDPQGPGAATWLQETRREGDSYLVNPKGVVVGADV